VSEWKSVLAFQITHRYLYLHLAAYPLKNEKIIDFVLGLKEFEIIQTCLVDFAMGEKNFIFYRCLLTLECHL